MSFIVYGGDRKIIEKQLACEHKWHGPCRDGVSHYNKCLLCFATERGLGSWEEYLDAEKGASAEAREEA